MVRINHWLSQRGVCSRREADRRIRQGRVLINERPARLGQAVLAEDRVCCDHIDIAESPPKPFLYLYHKPVGVVSSHDKRVTNNLLDALCFDKLPSKFHVIGRLDKASEGLMLLTNQGELTNALLQPKSRHEKEYQVWVDQPITPDFIQAMAAGVQIFHHKLVPQVTLPCRVDQEDEYCFRIVLTQGLNRQIRRMSQTLGYRVVRLKRIRIGQYQLDDLGQGCLKMADDCV